MLQAPARSTTYYFGALYGGGVATTVPIGGSQSVPGAGSVLLWDRQKALALFQALQRDQPVAQ